MIIATGTLNIDENAKLAQQASDDAKNAANSAADEAGKVKTSLDGKITVSSQEPFDDGKTHDEGDIWYVQDSNHITSEMYTYDGSDWVKTKMSQTVLSVGQLSALSANLGTIEAGYLNSVEVDSSIIKGGSISGSSLSLTNGNTNYWLDQNGFHDSYYGNDIFNGYVKKDVWINESGISISDGNYKADIQPEQIKMSGGGGTGTIWPTNINWPAITISNNIQIKSRHIIHSIDYGALYFEGGSDGGEDGIDIHAGGVYSHGTNLLNEIKRIDGKPDSSGDISRIDGDISRIRSEISDIKDELKRKKNK
ncbi:hypothetical protein [Lentilactobacillus kefiri]|uniref:hypothetical protein n=1 Tax=Lentilactobacillus kefiri TaxID=33962 RepID=UPI001FBB786C|nr:hypothetical protein [Lentilactobacillus kefiri]MCJ2161945.1 hypothetical protein [Lentilactobacillus kefiri]